MFKIKSTKRQPNITISNRISVMVDSGAIGDAHGD